MEQKTSDKSPNTLLGSSTTIHVIGEVVVLGGMLYYVHSQTTQLNSKIVSLEQKVLELTNILKNMVPQAFPIETRHGMPLREGNGPQNGLRPESIVAPPSKEHFRLPSKSKWEFLKPSVPEISEDSDDDDDENCTDGVCKIPQSIIKKREKTERREPVDAPERNVTFNGSIEQLKYDGEKSRRSTKMMVGSPSMRPLVPQSIEIDEDERQDKDNSNETQAGFSGIRKMQDPSLSESEINQLVSKAIRKR